MPRYRQKQCDRCQTVADTLYRVQYGTLERWKFVCQACCRVVSECDRYVYGGTWKAKKRH
jgi:hypothetical protein